MAAKWHTCTISGLVRHVAAVIYGVAVAVQPYALSIAATELGYLAAERRYGESHDYPPASPHPAGKSFCQKSVYHVTSLSRELERRPRHLVCSGINQDKPIVDVLHRQTANQLNGITLDMCSITKWQVTL